jgi:integrase
MTSTQKGSNRKKPARLAWGNGSVRQRGAKFQVRWRENGERMSTSGFESRAEAMDELERIQARLKLGQPGIAPKTAPKVRGKRFADLLDEFIDHRRAHKIRSASEDRARWMLHLAPALEAQTIDSLTSQAVRHLAEGLVQPPAASKGPDGKKKDPVSGPTAHRAITLLSAFYAWAEDEELTTGNPAREALRNKNTKNLLKSDHKGEEAPYLKSWAEVDKLHAALTKADPTVAMAYYISARAGLRPGEVTALRWGSVDIDEKTIEVSTQARKGYEGPTKSGKTRTVPIVPALAAALKEWTESASGARGTKATDLVCPPPPPNRKFQTALGSKPGSTWGRYLDRVQIKNALAVAFVAAGIRPGTWYEYGRHTFGSLSGLGGISTWRLKEIMGHQDISTTERYVSLKGQALTPAELVALGA